ncbi:MAG: class I SAM-dependent methyltransferase [Acidobacteria bacterium]|nr:class I SAM-dependent methyltransferase [Acidobacteriota bacterium]
MFFLRKSPLERLPVVMSGVRMGERALQIGVGDPSLVGAIAAKVGLSGHASVAVAEARQAERARAAAARAGALVDVQMAPGGGALPFADAAFDVVVIHPGGLASPLHDAAGAAMLRDAHRMLRGGGRIVVIEGGGRGLAARLRSTPLADAAPVLAALGAAGFKAARQLAEREGYRFLEGLKSDATP